MEKLIDFFKDVGKLKGIKRLGWILGGTKEKETESIADHSYRLAVMVWVFGHDKKDLDVGKLLKMAMLHNFPVVNAGDITPYDDLVSKGEATNERLSSWPRRSKKEKEKIATRNRKKEIAALKKLVRGLPNELKTEVEELWHEYEYGTSAEGRFLKQVDRIEKLIQSIEYKEQNKYEPRIDPYWQQLKELLDDPDLIKFVESLDRYFYSSDKRVRIGNHKRPGG